MDAWNEILLDSITKEDIVWFKDCFKNTERISIHAKVVNEDI